LCVLLLRGYDAVPCRFSPQTSVRNGPIDQKRDAPTCLGLPVRGLGWKTVV
jgi:hypothetical protein